VSCGRGTSGFFLRESAWLPTHRLPYQPGTAPRTHRHSGEVPGTPPCPVPGAAAPSGAPGCAPLGSSAAGAAPMPGSQTGVETQIEKVGQSHTGHDRAVTATGFPQPCPGPISRTPLPVLPLTQHSSRLYRCAAFADRRIDLSQSKSLPQNKDNLKL